MKRFSAAVVAALVAASLRLALVAMPAGAAGVNGKVGDSATEVEVPRKV